MAAEAMEVINDSATSNGAENKLSDSIGAETAESKEDSLGPHPPGRDYPLTLHWSFGINSNLPVHNISDGSRKMVFYVCGHTGVLLDCEENSQRLLQGHSNRITCTAVSGDKRWLVTADCGCGAMLTVWDSYTVVPVRSIFEGLGEGCQVVAMSTDAKYIAAISTGSPQVLSVWDWTIESDHPICHMALNVDYGRQSFLTFHPTDHTQLISNSEDTVVFYFWKGSKIDFHSTPVIDKDFNKPIGVFTQSSFIPGTNQAITGNTEGSAVVWEDATPTSEGDTQTAPHVKRPLKLMKIYDSPVTVVTTTANLLVTGDTEGEVKFFDSELKMLNWYDGDTIHGHTVSISFAHQPKIKQSMERTAAHFPAESTMSAKPFVIPDFTVSTSSAEVVHITTNGSISETLIKEHEAAINALAGHPSLPHLLIGSYSCKLKLWNYQTKKVVCVRNFKDGHYIQCVAFDPNGHYIGVGFTNGVVGILDSLTLEDACSPFQYSREAVTKVVFSHDSTFMATADLEMCVSVYMARPSDQQQPWQFFARYRAHYKKIEDLMFGVKLDSDSPRLLSIARDRTIVEYDLSSSSVDDLRLHSTDRIEQSATPTSMTWFPPITKESFILVANDQFKLKLFNSTTKMCRKTLLGPTFGSPLTKLLLLPAPVQRDKEGQETRRYLAYTTTDKVGLLILPHDGNPHNTQCLVAHPGAVTELASSYDGEYVFTAGGDDCTVNMWAVNTRALEALSLLGGEGLEPFYAMLDGGREGEFFAELEEFFYYAQIRSQGPDTTARREISTHIPVEQIPYLMRAIGFYPSEQEIEEMLNEVKFSRYIETKSNVTEIDLGDFIKLYVNHRPAFGIPPSQIKAAFKVLGERFGKDQDWRIDRASFLSLMQEKGEHLTEMELIECMMTLLGYSDNPEIDGCFTEDTEEALVSQVPETLSADDFAGELLGLNT